MSDPIETALLVVGMLLAALFPVAVCFSRSRSYSAWARIGSVVTSVAALGWGTIGFGPSRPHFPVSGHAYYSLVHTKGLLGGICLGIGLSILSARPYHKIVHAPSKA